MGDREPNEQEPIGNPKLPARVPVLGAALLASACAITSPPLQVHGNTFVPHPNPTATSPGPSPKLAPGPVTVNHIPPVASPTPHAVMTGITSINFVAPTPSPTAHIPPLNGLAPSPSPTASSTAVPTATGTAKVPYLNGMLPISRMLGATEPSAPTT